MKSRFEGYMDVTFRDVPYQYVIYRTENFVYEEGLVDGRWVSLFYNSSGHVAGHNEIVRPKHYVPEKVHCPEAFEIVLDGQSINNNLEWEHTEREKKDGKISVHITLRHTKRPVRVHVVTVLDGTLAIERRIDIENCADHSAALSAFAPLSGCVEIADYKRGFYPAFNTDYEQSIWRVGYFDGTQQANEGNFRWRDLYTDGMSIFGRNRGRRYRHPMCVLNNKITGAYLMLQFAWSGGYAFEFEYAHDWNTSSTLCVKAALDSAAPMRVIAPGETWKGPEIHFGMCFGGLDEIVNGMNHHIRNVVLPKDEDKRELVVVGMGAEYNMDVPHTKAMLDYAADIGAEAFFLDAGWFVEPGVEVSGEWERWNGMVGEWKFNPNRYTNGIQEIINYAHEKNILFGVWMEPERIGKLCSIYNKHQDWVLRGRDGKPNDVGYLNLAIPECAQWIEDEATKLIGDNNLDFFRLDFNVNWPMYIGTVEVDGYIENTFVRQNQAIYRIFENLRKKFPHVIFENCASGGARTDIGMIKNFYHTWVTDWQIQPNAFRITNGMTMALPPEHINRMMGGQHSYMFGDFMTMLRSLMFTQFSVCNIRSEIDGMNTNDRHVEEIARYVKLYKQFIRPFIKASDVYHHTPELPGDPPKGCGILELASESGDRGILGVFRLADPCEDTVCVRLRGLDPSKRFHVYSDNKRCSYDVEGWKLCDEGIHISISGQLSSEFMTFEAIN